MRGAATVVCSEVIDCVHKERDLYRTNPKSLSHAFYLPHATWLATARCPPWCFGGCRWLPRAWPIVSDGWRHRCLPRSRVLVNVVPLGSPRRTQACARHPHALHTHDNESRCCRHRRCMPLMPRFTTVSNAHPSSDSSLTGNMAAASGADLPCVRAPLGALACHWHARTTL